MTLLKRRTIGIFDKPIGDFVVIAAIAVSNEEPVATRDVERFSRVPGLSVDRW